LRNLQKVLLTRLEKEWKTDKSCTLLTCSLINGEYLDLMVTNFHHLLKT